MLDKIVNTWARVVLFSQTSRLRLSLGRYFHVCVSVCHIGHGLKHMCVCRTTDFITSKTISLTIHTYIHVHTSTEQCIENTVSITVLYYTSGSCLKDNACLNAEILSHTSAFPFSRIYTLHNTYAWGMERSYPTVCGGAWFTLDEKGRAQENS